jgi:hypothetical protein
MKVSQRVDDGPEDNELYPSAVVGTETSFLLSPGPPLWLRSVEIGSIQQILYVYTQGTTGAQGETLEKRRDVILRSYLVLSNQRDDMEAIETLPRGLARNGRHLEA